MSHADDLAAVEALLGRRPNSAFEVVVRDVDGSPVVLRNAPFLDDGTPMPTRYWLVGRRHSAAVGRLEADGGVRRAEAEIDPQAIADAHARYAAERDTVVEAMVGAHYTGPRPSGGVGGTRTGVKCLHAHLAWFLAGGDDPVGAWTAARVTLDPMEPATLDLQPRADIDLSLHLHLDDHRLAARLGQQQVHLPIGVTDLREMLHPHDPPRPIDLTNAIGAVVDHLDDLLREAPAAVDAPSVHLHGAVTAAIAAVEVGASPTLPLSITRDAAEEVFRTVATEPVTDRRRNPGLPADHVDDIVAGCCALVAVMRHLHLQQVHLCGADA